MFVPSPRGPQRWELFNVEEDPGETNDLRDCEPNVFDEMTISDVTTYAKVDITGQDREFIALTEQANPGAR